MRVLGTILMLLGLVGLITGLVTGFASFDTAKQLYTDIEEGRAIVTDKIDEVNEVFSDIDVVYERSQRTIRDYEQGRIQNLQDQRIKDLLRDVRKVSERSMTLKEGIKDDLKKLDTMRTAVNGEYERALFLGVISLACLVLSGWVFGLGALARGAARRAR